MAYLPTTGKATWAEVAFQGENLCLRRHQNFKQVPERLEHFLTSHDVQSGQVSPGELHRPEELVPDVRAKDVVLLFGDLTRQPHDDLLYSVSGQEVLK